MVLSLAIGGFLFWLLREAGLSFWPSEEAFRQLKPWALPAFVGFWLVATALRVYRWLHLLRPIDPEVSVKRVVAVGLVGFAALFAPMRMGEFARPWLITRDRRIGFVQAFGTVAAERIVDGVMLSVLLAIAMWVADPVLPLPDHIGKLKLPMGMVPVAASSALVVFLSLFVAMAVFYFWRATAHRIVSKVVGLVSKRLAELITQQLDRLSDSFSFLLSRTHGLAFLRDTLAFWLAQVCAIMALLRGSGADADLAQSMVVLGVLGLSTALPGPPGFYGVYQLGAYCGMAMYFPQQLLTSGALFTFISYCTQLIAALLALLAGFWLLGGAKGRASDAAPSQPADGPGAPSTPSHNSR